MAPPGPKGRAARPAMPRPAWWKRAGWATARARNDWWEVRCRRCRPARSSATRSARPASRAMAATAWTSSGRAAQADIDRKAKMMGVWQVTNINAATIQYRPHADYGATATGLKDGFHIISARAFLNRNDGCAIYNTFKQTFYLDARDPAGLHPVARERRRHPLRLGIRRGGAHGSDGAGGLVPHRGRRCRQRRRRHRQGQRQRRRFRALHGCQRRRRVRSRRALHRSQRQWDLDLQRHRFLAEGLCRSRRTT